LLASLAAFWVRFLENVVDAKPFNLLGFFGCTGREMGSFGFFAVSPPGGGWDSVVKERGRAPARSAAHADHSGRLTGPTGACGDVVELTRQIIVNAG
jgi:hypothetical protein